MGAVRMRSEGLDFRSQDKRAASVVRLRLGEDIVHLQEAHTFAAVMPEHLVDNLGLDSGVQKRK